MNKSLLVVVFLLQGLVSNGQLRSEFTDVLKSVLTHTDVANLVFVDFPVNHKTTYILTHETIVSNTENYYENFFKAYPSDTLGSKVFSTNQGDVIIFDSPLRLDIASKSQIKTIVVVDKFRRTNKGFKVALYTTNLETKRWYRANGAKRKFKRINCNLVTDGTTLTIASVKFTDKRHKDIY